MVKKSKYGEVLKADLEERKTTSHVKFHMKYHIHDIVGAELVQRSDLLNLHVSKRVFNMMQ